MDFDLGLCPFSIKEKQQLRSMYDSHHYNHMEYAFRSITLPLAL